jgi:glycosyltransferase involved in cell wall biosynthesis
MSGTILVLAPMPGFPTSAGNRRRLMTTCDSLKRGGFSVDFAYFAHEDQIYRRFGQHPPTDMAAMAKAFQRLFVIEPRAAIPLKTRARCFGIDDWCPDEVGDFVAWYFAAHPETRAILVNYVFLSRCLERVPAGVLRLIDTHDRFADRQQQYRPVRAEPNFFYTDRAGEAAGLDRADIVLAIQSEEARYFREITDREVHLLPPRFLAQRPFAAPERLRRVGFIGHGNDPNLFSISRFAHAWVEDWVPGRPELVIAGEICNSLGGLTRPGIRLDGYVARLEDFYDCVDLVVAPMLMGSGLKMKVAEALSFGKPVIGTTIGFEGFEPVIPEHRSERAEAVKAQALALADDPAGLAALTQACEGLFTRYNALAQDAEDALVRDIRERTPEGLAAHRNGDAVKGADSPVTTRFGGVALTATRSLDSLTREHSSYGILVATEMPPRDALPYDPVRRRWFARAAEGEAGSGPELAGLRATLAPEWVRDRRLPAALRAELAVLMAGLLPDWEAQARLIGIADGLTLAGPVPSFLVGAPHPCAAFLIDDRTGSAVELVMEAATPLQSDAGLRFIGHTRADLTPVPAAVRLQAPAGATIEGRRVLLLTDDLIGSITLFRPSAMEAA